MYRHGAGTIAKGAVMDIRELHLLTSDLTRQLHFYVDRLSLPVVAVRPDSLVLQVGTTRLTFKQAPLEAHQIYHFAFNVPPRQFIEAKAWIAQRVPLLSDHTGTDQFFFETWNAHALYFYDPVGNIVELIARNTLADRQHGPFTAQSLLNVSEIGLVTDSVRDTVDMLRTRLGVSIYQGTGSDEFTPVGDESGLFIVVKQGRIWFPDTGKAAAPAPVSITVAEGNVRATIAGPPYQILPQSHKQTL